MSYVTHDAASTRKPGALLRLASAGFANAGRTYNVGNVVALLTGIAAPLAAGGDATLLDRLATAFFGSSSAVMVTMGSLTFMLSGARYDRAWRDRSEPDGRRLFEGDLLSGAGSVLMGFGLAGLATTPLGAVTALAGGGLGAAGKLGSAFVGDLGAFKLAPLVSRVFSLVSLIGDLNANASAAQLATASILSLCIAIWARADAMLLSKGQASGLAALLGLLRPH